MAKKAKTEPKIHLRRCAVCQKMGHNKSTCQERLERFEQKPYTPTSMPNPNSQAVRQPLKFFVHHVQYQNHESSNLVNLKESANSLSQNIHAAAPSQNKDLYFFHEVIPNNPAPKIEPVNIPKISFTPEKITPPKIPSPALQKANELSQKISDKFSQIKNYQVSVPKFTIPKINFPTDKIRALVSPKRIVGVALAVVFLLFAPTAARTYYFDLKSTTDKIADSSTAGFAALHDSTSALMSGNIGNAQESLTNALQSFDQAVELLSTKYSILQKIVGVVPIMNNQIQSRQRLITAGQEISLGNTYLIKGLSEIQYRSSTLTNNLKSLGDHLNYSLPHYQQALADLNKVDSDILPFEYQDTFKEFRVLFNLYVKDLDSINKLNNSVQEIFGGKGLRRYLLVFQNPAEIRPTGGFMGSFALLDIKDGEIVNIDIPAGGSYDLQGQLKEFVAPPTPLLLSNKRWEFQDANWFPDFSASAEKMLWFYRHSRNLTADGVIAINADVLNRLLSIIGPIADQSRNLVIDKNNALSTIQDIVENGPEKKDHKPKQILSDLAPVFIENFKKMKAQAVLPILTNLSEALQQKEIQAYFVDDNTQNTMKEFGWSGEIAKTTPDQDYLLVVNTNIQGQKSDAKIKQSISHQAVVQPDGTILDSVVITREHTGIDGEDLYGKNNIDYLRIYVPEGSQLVRASGFTWPDEKAFKVPDPWYNQDEQLNNLEKEIDTDDRSGTRISQEFGKTAFGNWIITEPGQTTQVQFTYKLPFKAWAESTPSNLSNWAKIFQSQNLLSKYQLIAQKQSGVNSDFESQVIYPKSWSPIWQDGRDLTVATNGIAVKNTKLNTDQIWVLVMQKQE
jgi:hypothetical protein